MKVLRIDQVARLAQRKFPPILKAALRRRASPNIEKVLEVWLHQLSELALAATEYIDAVLSRLRESGLHFSIYFTCCRREDCHTCMGQFPSHYPYIRFPDKRVVKTRDLAAFLRGAGLSEEEVESFMTAIDVRNALIKMHNYAATLFNRAGLVRVRYE